MRFKVVEVRAYQAEYLVEAESEDAAKRLAGTLRTLALCLDCEMTFDVIARACPACGDDHFVLVARLLNRDTTACSWTTSRKRVPDDRTRAHAGRDAGG